MAQTISEQIAELKQDIAGFFKAKPDNAEALAKAQKENADLSAKLSELEAKILEQDSTVAKLKGELATAEAKAKEASDNAEKIKAESAQAIKDAEESVEKLAGIKALGIEQKRGISAPVTETPKATPQADKSASLKGLSKAQAAFEQQLSKN